MLPYQVYECWVINGFHPSLTIAVQGT